jgi:antitoxin ParD1/3/4
MVVQLTPRVAELIRRKVATGHHRSADEVIEDALDALEQRDRLVRLKAAIAIGDAQLARGEGVPYTDQLVDEIEREADEALRRTDSARS